MIFAMVSDAALFLAIRISTDALVFKDVSNDKAVADGLPGVREVNSDITSPKGRSPLN